MSGAVDEIAALDKVIHEPARLAILTALSECRSADFVFLMRLTGLTQGNLSVHLSKLEAAALVSIRKKFEGKRPKTTVQLTAAGRKAIEAHWKQLESLRRRVRSELKSGG